MVVYTWPHWFANISKFKKGKEWFGDPLIPVSQLLHRTIRILNSSMHLETLAWSQEPSKNSWKLPDNAKRLFTLKKHIFASRPYKTRLVSEFSTSPLIGLSVILAIFFCCCLHFFRESVNLADSTSSYVNIVNAKEERRSACNSAATMAWSMLQYDAQEEHYEN